MISILTTNFVSVHHYAEEKSIEVKWKENISLRDCELVSESLKKHLKDDYFLILNNTGINDLSSDVKTWFKQKFLRRQLNELSSTINHLITIRTSDQREGFVSSMNSLISILNPGLKSISFRSVEEAQGWIYTQRLRSTLKKRDEVNAQEDYQVLLETADLVSEKTSLKNIFSSILS